MAITNRSRREKRYGISGLAAADEQTTWGTAVADDKNFIELACDDTLINPDTKVRESDEAHGTLLPIAAEVHVDHKGALPTVPFAGAVKKDEIDHLIFAMLQSVTEDVSTPFKKTNVFATTQPDFSASAGHFLTVIERFPVASSSTKIADCVAHELKFTLTPGGMLMYSVGLTGRGIPIFNANPSGTWTISDNDESTDFFYCQDMDRFTFNDGSPTSLILTGPLDFSIVRPVTGVGQDGSGDWQTIQLGKPVITFSAAIMDNEAVRVSDMIAAKNAGTQVDWNFSWGNVTPGTDDGDLDFAFSGKLTKVDSDNADTLGIAIESTILGDDSTTAPLTIIVANAIDRTW